MVKPLTVYKASAGSGKTFTLATEYIRLVVENPLCFRNILAVTFTNKATEEMKMRILSQLYGIWKALPESDGYLKKVQESTGLKEELIRERSGIALHHLTHHYNEFRVMTIDTFFQSVLRNLARELDLTATLRIGLNDIQVEEMAVDQMIHDLTANDVILKWIMRYILDNISDDRSWNVISQIKQFGRTLFKDEYKAVADILQEKLDEPGFFDKYTKNLKEIRDAAKQQMQDIADEFFTILDSESLTIDDFSFGKSGVAGTFQKLRDGAPFDESLIGKRAHDSVGDTSKWYKKTHPHRDLLYKLVDKQLDPLLRKLIDNRPQQWCLYQSAEVTLKHLSQLRLLGTIATRVRALNEESNRFLLSDTQQLLHDLIEGSDSPFIFEKIGAQLQHVMIDEFQDTSTVQWQNFKVLLDEAMSHQQSGNLIVGDVKQSIYRWRSGDWRLLNDIESQFPNPSQQLEVRNLARNYRSARRIIEFNNAFFTKAAELEFLNLDDIPEAEQLKKAYADVIQDVPENKPDEGTFLVKLLPDDDYQETMLQELVSHVSNLIEADASPKDIAILVRTNSLIPLIAQYFMLHLPEVSIISDEAFRLDASAAVCTIIDALRLLTHSDDILTKASLVKRYQREILGRNLTDDQLLLRHKDFDTLLPEEFISEYESLRQMPLYELIERLYIIFSLSSLEGQSAYVCAFFDRLNDFLQDSLSPLTSQLSHHTSRLSPLIPLFLKEWNETISGKTIQSDEIHGIRIISIHKSKGLEFPHVIIPFCDWSLEHQGSLLWCQPGSAPFNDLPLAPVDYSSKSLLGTIYEPAYHHEHLQNTVDNLNLLYVAFTRASQSLIVLGKRNTSASSRSSLIEQVLHLLPDTLSNTTLEGLEPSGSPLILHSNSGFKVSLDLESPANEKLGNHKVQSFKNPFSITPSPLKIQVSSFAPHMDFRQSNRSMAFINGEDESDIKSYIQLGSILHEVFSTIRTTADIAPALKRLELEGILYDENNTSEKVISMLRKRLNNPKVRDWFSDKYKLYNECTILKLEGGQLQERRPDRVMTDGKNWIIVDFKFGSPKPEYESQVREYMSLIREMHPAQEITIQGYLWFVYSNKIVEVS